MTKTSVTGEKLVKAQKKRMVLKLHDKKRGDVQMELNFISISCFVVIARLCAASLYPADTGLLCHSDPG